MKWWNLPGRRWCRISIASRSKSGSATGGRTTGAYKLRLQSGIASSLAGRQRGATSNSIARVCFRSREDGSMTEDQKKSRSDDLRRNREAGSDPLEGTTEIPAIHHI